MRRRRIAEWEIEARDATERLREQLHQMVGVERAIDGGGWNSGEIAKALNTEWETTSAITEWLPALQALGWEDVPSKALPALRVFQVCLPRLLLATDTIQAALAIFAWSPKLDGGDRELAGQALSKAQEVAALALLLLSDTPALGRGDTVEASQAIKGIEGMSASFPAMAKKVLSRAIEIRQDIRNPDG